MSEVLGGEPRWTIPDSWSWMTMADVSEIVGGGTPDTKSSEYWGGTIPWITPADLSGYRAKMISVGGRSLTTVGLEHSGARLMPTGTVLLSSRAPVGYVAIAANPIATNQGFKSFVLREGLLPDYLYWYLSGNTELIREFASGTTFTEVSGRRAAEIPIPIPPWAEQRRIVAAIEEHLSELDAAVAGLERARVSLDRFRRAVLKSCVGLSRREDRGSPHAWHVVTIGEIAEVGTGATPLRSDASFYKDGTIPWITSGALNEHFVTAAEQFVTLKALRETNLTIYPPGTLLVAMYGEGRTRGKCSELTIAATTNQAVAAIRMRPEFEHCQPWLKLFLHSHYEEMRAFASGGVQPNLNLGIIRSISLPLPPPAQQIVLVQEAELQMSLVTQVRQSIDVQLARATRLRQSILKHAFEGKLVPQDPNDEPASVLLDRIRAEREAAAPRAPKSRPKAKPPRKAPHR